MNGSSGARRGHRAGPRRGAGAALPVRRLGNSMRRRRRCWPPPGPASPTRSGLGVSATGSSSARRRRSFSPAFAATVGRAVAVAGMGAPPSAPSRRPLAVRPEAVSLGAGGRPVAEGGGRQLKIGGRHFLSCAGSLGRVTLSHRGRVLGIPARTAHRLVRIPAGCGVPALGVAPPGSACYACAFSLERGRAKDHMRKRPVGVNLRRRTTCGTRAKRRAQKQAQIGFRRGQSGGSGADAER